MLVAQALDLPATRFDGRPRGFFPYQVAFRHGPEDREGQYVVVVY